MAERGGRAARALRAAWPAVGWAALIFVLSHRPRPLPFALPFHGADKVAHAVAFGLLGALAARGLQRAGVALRLALVLAVAAGSAYGALDEWHQSFVPGRDPDPWDWVADTVGCALGALVVSLPVRWLRASIRG